MQRYFVENVSEFIEINKQKYNDIYYHLTKVLRVKADEYIELCDSKTAQCFLFKISDIDANTIKCNKQERLADNELRVKVYLAQCFLKNHNFELVLQKSVELGVFTIIPIESNRTIIKSKNFSGNKFSRFNKIIKEASEQSKRSIIPKLENVHNLEELINYPCSQKFIAFENSNIDNLLWSSIDTLIADCLILIGPEGGFEDEEIDYLLNNGFKIVSLGKRILRAETAAIASLSIISSKYELTLEE